MKDWNSIYKKKGAFQKDISGYIKDAIEFFKQNNVKHVLDLGCGTGRHTKYLLKKGFNVRGCDVSEKALEIMEDKFPEVEVKNCDMTALAYNDNSFDAVFCHHVIQHGKMEDIKKVASEISRVTKKKGILFLVALSINHPKLLTGEKIEDGTYINTDSEDGNLPHHFFTEEELKNLFSDFEILNLEEHNKISEIDYGKKSYFYVMYGKKK
jgi:ubiquinone/menaquinone biosynthesis C-methylase UbiE